MEALRSLSTRLLLLTHTQCFLLQFPGVDPSEGRKASGTEREDQSGREFDTSHMRPALPFLDLFGTQLPSLASCAELSTVGSEALDLLAVLSPIIS